jgi:hypothetical protein
MPGFARGCHTDTDFLVGIVAPAERQLGPPKVGQDKHNRLGGRFEGHGDKEFSDQNVE